MKRLLLVFGMISMGAGVALAQGAADSIVVYGSHSEKKPTDPVPVKIEKFKVTKAKLDPKKVEGGTATIELDLTSLKTDSAKRDGHLKSGDYLDAAKFGTATIDIANVKKKAGQSYTADATITIKGVALKRPVQFEVVETLPDGIRIKGEHAFTRKDINIGKETGDPVAQDLKIALQLTLKNTP